RAIAPPFVASITPPPIDGQETTEEHPHPDAGVVRLTASTVAKPWTKMLQTSRKRTRSTLTFFSQRQPSPSYASTAM
ncbi:hypothetical protein BGW80DRAFT_1303722, partial [Lactifluus volemus]